MKRALVVICCVAMLFAFSPVFAQNAGKIEAGDLGFSFFTGLSYLSGDIAGGNETLCRVLGIGAMYYPIASIAVEPGIFFSKRDYTFDDKQTGNDREETGYLYVGGTLGVFYNMEIGGGLYMYMGPRIDFARYERDRDYENGSRNETRRKDTAISAILGFKYMVSDHFGVFADMGIGFYSYKNTAKYWDTAGNVTDNEETTNDTIALSRALVGVVFLL